jgi:hypothetical protein
LVALLLAGCGAGRVTSSAPAPHPTPDCSFDAATTCWTLGPRVPAPYRPARDTAPDRLLRPPPAVLAIRADSVTPNGDGAPR